MIKYCYFLKNNNYNIANGCLCIKDNIVHYRGNSLIFDKNISKYLLNNIYQNKNNIHDDAIFPLIFKDIEYLKIHSAPFRYYCKEGIFINHPQKIDIINKDNCNGVVFISFRITYNINEKYKEYNSRYIELGRCYEIDSIYNKLNNELLKNNLNIIFNCDTNNFIKCDSIIQKNKLLTFI